MADKNIHHQIFISYRRAGGDAMAYLLKKELDAKGYPTFLDVESLDSGQFDTALLAKIDACANVILILSPNALDRCKNSGDWVRLEICHALAAKKNLIPVILKGFEWPDELPEDLKVLQNYHGLDEVNFLYFEEHIDKLMSLLQKDVIKVQRQKRVLAWDDFTGKGSKGLLDKLTKKLNQEYEFIKIDDPFEITHYDLNAIHAVILFNTDVTKLATSEKTRTMLNERLSDFVFNGGLLLGTHDLIYRRTGNELLQEAFGYTTKFFEARERVEYHKTEECKELNAFTSLEDCFFLTDEEICWGDIDDDLADDVTVYFTGNSTKSDEAIPLVFGREHGDGLCFWINTGETKMKPPRSVTNMENPLILLINEILNMEM